MVPNLSDSAMMSSEFITHNDRDKHVTALSSKVASFFTHNVDSPVLCVLAFEA
jgi:general stress protein 26